MPIVRTKSFGDVTSADLRDLAAALEEQVAAARLREPGLAKLLREGGTHAATDEMFVREFVLECEEVFARNLRECADHLEGRVATKPGKAVVAALGFLDGDETADQLYEELIKLLARAAQVGFVVTPDEDDVGVIRQDTRA